MRKLLIIGVLLSGCSTGAPESAYRSSYSISYNSCERRIGVLTLNPAEYAETEQYRSKVDPDLDDKAAIRAVYARKYAQAMDKCRVEAHQQAKGSKASVENVGLPMVFVAPLY